MKQNIDANFSEAQAILSTKILPAFRRYAINTEPVREAAKVRSIILSLSKSFCFFGPYFTYQGLFPLMNVCSLHPRNILLSYSACIFGCDIELRDAECSLNDLLCLLVLAPIFRTSRTNPYSDLGRRQRYDELAYDELAYEHSDGNGNGDRDCYGDQHRRYVSIYLGHQQFHVQSRQDSFRQLLSSRPGSRIIYSNGTGLFDAPRWCSIWGRDGW